jgi:hypothetical protein
MKFIDLTEMWQDHHYLEVGNYIKTVGWTPRETAEFCAYFCKYLGTKQLELLYKFI